MSRVESVCRARCVRSNSSRVRPMRSAALGMSLGGSTSTFGLGVLAQASSLTSRCSSSRTLVRYSSSLSRSSAPRSDRSAVGLIADVVEDAPAVFEAAHLGLHFVGPAFEEQLGEHLATASCPPARAPRCASTTGRALRPTGPGWGTASGRRCARPRIDRARSRCESRAGPRPARRSGSWPTPGARTPDSCPRAPARR